MNVYFFEMPPSLDHDDIEFEYVATCDTRDDARRHAVAFVQRKQYGCVDAESVTLEISLSALTQTFDDADDLFDVFVDGEYEETFIFFTTRDMINVQHVDVRTLYDVFDANDGGSFVMRAPLRVIGDYYRLRGDAMRRVVNCIDGCVMMLHGSRKMGAFKVVISRVDDVSNMPTARVDVCDDASHMKD